MDAQRAGTLVAAAFPDLSVHHVRPYGEGWANFAFLVNEELLFRFPKTERVAVATFKELKLLPALAAAGLPLPTPALRYAAPDGVPDFPWPFAGYPLIPGIPAAELPPGRLAPQAAGAVGDFLTALHRFPGAQATALGVPGGPPGTWRAEYEVWYAETRAMVWPCLSEAQQAAAALFIEAFLGDDRHFRFQPVLLHRDLSADHLLADPATGRLTGVIDFEDATVGDPAFDLTGVIHLGPGVLDHYRGPMDPGFFERIRFYTRLWPLHQLRYGLESGRSDHIEKGLARLRADLGG